MSDISIDEIKKKFQELQTKTQKLKEEKVGYEAQLETLKSQYDEQLQALLSETGSSSLDEAIALCKRKQEELSSLKESLQQTLESYESTIESQNMEPIVTNE